MQDFNVFLSNHPYLSSGIFIVLILTMIVEFIRARRAVYAINPQALTHLINHENAVVIDLRPATEFKSGHIINALNISSSDIQTNPKKLDKYRVKPVVLVCNQGRESQKVAATLLKSGYNAYSLSGGIKSWIDAQLPLVKD